MPQLHQINQAFVENRCQPSNILTLPIYLLAYLDSKRAPKPKSNSKPKAYASRAKSQAQAELKSFYQLALTLTPASTLRLQLRTPPDPAPTTIPNLKSKSKNFTAEIWAYQPTTPSSYLPTVLIQKSKTKHETSISCHRLPDQQSSYVRSNLNVSRFYPTQSVKYHYRNLPPLLPALWFSASKHTHHLTN